MDGRVRKAVDAKEDILKDLLTIKDAQQDTSIEWLPYDRKYCYTPTLKDIHIRITTPISLVLLILLYDSEM